MFFIICSLICLGCGILYLVVGIETGLGLIQIFLGMLSSALALMCIIKKKNTD